MTGDFAFVVKRGDTAKPLRFHLRRENSDGTYSDIDLSGASAAFYMRERGKRTNTVDGSACTISAATSGKGYYDFQAADVDTAGIYDAEIVVTYSDSTIESFPEDEHLTIIIIDDLS